ncbi:type II secretion system protein N [Hylemonella sp. W303a]|uniref:type II secretion system protein N n=1 Tax=Hylemonella sp. W303a TaxID=3389873 RepID=UPI00396B3489
MPLKLPFLALPPVRHADRTRTGTHASDASAGVEAAAWPRRAPLLGLCAGVLAAMVVFAPARWLAAGVASLTGGRVLLTEPKGQVWAGQAGLTLSAGPGAFEKRALPQGVNWRLRLGWSRGSAHGQSPSWLGEPVLRVDITAPCCAPEPLRLSIGSLFSGTPAVVLEAHRSEWPASWLAGLGAPWNTLALQGQLMLTTPGLRWQEQRLEGELEVHALHVASALSTLKPLGSYRLHVSSFGTDSGGVSRSNADYGRNPAQDNLGAGSTIYFVLTTLQGDLQLSAQGQWRGGRLRLQGQAEAAPDRIDALSNLLNILGRRDGLRSYLTLG